MNKKKKDKEKSLDYLKKNKKKNNPDLLVAFSTSKMIDPPGQGGW
ncbi:MAG: hypothetical protein ACW97Z_09825 [Candidatus Hodarchaeales archaeon]